MRKYIAEFLGTAILVLIGCGSAVGANAMFSAMGLLPAAFTTLSTAVAFGLTLLVVICIFGRYSGAHYRYISESGQIAGSCAVSGRRGDQPGLGLHRGASCRGHFCRSLRSVHEEGTEEEKMAQNWKGKRIGRRRCGRS